RVAVVAAEAADQVARRVEALHQVAGRSGRRGIPVRYVEVAVDVERDPARLTVRSPGEDTAQRSVGCVPLHLAVGQGDEDVAAGPAVPHVDHHGVGGGHETQDVAYQRGQRVAAVAGGQRVPGNLVRCQRVLDAQVDAVELELDARRRELQRRGGAHADGP